MRGAAILLAALAAASCVSDPHAEPIPGRDARVILLEGKTASAPWPTAWSRGARFLLVNGTGAPVETVLLDLGGEGAPEELVEAVVEDPPGAEAAVLPSPVGSWPLRARVGTPGSVLLEPGAALTLRLRVLGRPGKARARFDVPR